MERMMDGKKDEKSRALTLSQYVANYSGEENQGNEQKRKEEGEPQAPQGGASDQHDRRGESANSASALPAQTGKG